jgi:signal transduction histidine kinase
MHGMLKQEERVSGLAALLRRHQDDIATAWAERVHALPGTHYSERPIEEVHAWVSHALAAIVETLSTGSYQATEAYLRNVSLARLRMGFGISEVIEALLTLKEAVLPVVWRTYPAGSAVAREAIAALDTYQRFMIGRFGHLYAEGMNADLSLQQKRTALILEAVEAVNSSLELDQVLQRIVQKSSAVFGRGCNLYLRDAEGNAFVPRARSGATFGELGIPDGDQGAAFGTHYLSPNSDGLIREIMERKEPIACYDAAVDPRFSRELVQTLGLKSALAVPIAADDQVLGVVICNTVDHYTHFAAQDVEVMEGLVNAVGLAVQNAQLYDKTRQRLAEIQSLQRVTTALLQQLTLEKVLEIVHREACQLAGARGCALFSLVDGDWLEVSHSGGVLEWPTGRIPVAGSLIGRAVVGGEPLLIDDPSDLARAAHPVSQLACLLIIPMRLGESVVGALSVADKPGGFTQDDVRLLSIFADAAAIAIDRAQLHQQAAQLAVVEERQRLARELHDSVTQALYSVTLYAEATRMALSAGKSDVAAENLEELHNLAREAMIDMRMLLFELHPPVLEEEGLVAALQARLATVESRAGLQTEIQVEGERRLPLAIEEALFRIALEGFNNVVKHARAERVTVRLVFNDEAVCLEIRDDGRGFDLAGAGQTGGMGLPGMEERASQIGGTLAVASAPGAGTTVRVEASVPEP